jgi:hypothetical protein
MDEFVVIDVDGHRYTYEAGDIAVALSMHHQASGASPFDIIAVFKNVGPPVGEPQKIEGWAGSLACGQVCDGGVVGPRHEFGNADHSGDCVRNLKHDGKHMCRLGHTWMAP